MGNAPRKKTETNVSGIFSIPAIPSDNGAIPGVTQLLERKDSKPKFDQKITSLEHTRTGNLKTLPKAGPPEKKYAAPPSGLSIDFGNDKGGDKTSVVMSPVISLSDFGILFELRFHSEEKSFRYESAQGHKESRLLPWQEQIFERIKMDKTSVPAKEPFQEFRAEQDAFLFEAFAVQPQHYIQIITPENTGTRIVLVSERSVIEHAAQIVEHFSRG